jgi:hypothetical protein
MTAAENVVRRGFDWLPVLWLREIDLLSKLFLSGKNVKNAVRRRFPESDGLSS